MNDQESVRRPTERRHRGSLMWPLILIALGLVFLLNNMGLVTGDVWEIILRFWPLLLIAIGLDAIWRREGLAGAAFMIGVGIVFLLGNFGYLTLSVWEVILRLWPVLLIAIGFDIVIGRRSIWASLAGLVIILALLAGALWLFGVRVSQPGQALAGEQISQALDGASAARVVIEPGAGSLHLDALSEGAALVSGRVPDRRGRQVRQDFSHEGDRAVYTLRARDMTFFFPGSSGNWEWDLGVNPDVPLDLRVDLGAGEADLILTGVDLTALDVNMGVGQARVTLPETGRFEVDIEGAIGQLIVVIPRGMDARITASTALGGLNVPGSFRRDGNTYVSPGYASAADRVDLNVSQAIGQIVIEQR